jgi:hypothetical protein
MSYRNPRQTFEADPLAFQKSFQQAFGSAQNLFEQQRVKLEEERKEKEELEKQLDISQAAGMASADIGLINGVDIRFNDALQDSINSIIDEGKFANASAVEQQKMLQQIRGLKAVYTKIGEVAGVDANDWDYRNDPRLTSLKTAINNGNVEIVGEGLNVQFKMPDGKTLSANDIATLKAIDKTPFREAYNELTNNIQKITQKGMVDMYKVGLDPSNAIRDGKQAFIDSIESQEDDGFLSYLWENVLPDSFKMNGVAKYKDKEVLSKLDPSAAGQVVEDQKQTLYNYLWSQQEAKLNPASDYAKRPLPKTVEVKEISSAEKEFNDMMSRFKKRNADPDKITLNFLQRQLGTGEGLYEYDKRTNQVSIKSGDMIERYNLKVPNERSALFSRVIRGAISSEIPTSQREKLSELADLYSSTRFINMFAEPAKQGPLNVRRGGTINVDGLELPIIGFDKIN